MKPTLRGFLFLVVGALLGYALGVGIVSLIAGSLTLVALVPILLATSIGLMAFFWGATGISAITKGFIWLNLGGVIGFVVGLLLDFIITGFRGLNWDAPVASLFVLLFGFTAFFLGVAGYNAAITRGLVSQVLGTLIGAIFVTLIRVSMGLGWKGAFLLY